MSANLAARLSAVETLQRLRARHVPGSARFDEIDHAIDLALKPKRAVGAFLVRNVLRDARRVLRRRRGRRRLTLESNYVITPGEPASIIDRLVDLASPEDEVSTFDLVREALARSPEIGRQSRLLQYLIEGRSMREVADLLAISPAYASQLSRQLKHSLRAAAGAGQNVEVIV